jgi:hypothetical protein
VLLKRSNESGDCILTAGPENKVGFETGNYAEYDGPNHRGPSRPSLADGIFPPSGSVAVVGATDREGSVGRTVLANLLSGLFHGRVYAVNSRPKNGS